MKLILPGLYAPVMAKHLPPSASTLRLVDIGGHTGQYLNELRADLDVTTVNPASWDADENSVDAIMVWLPADRLDIDAVFLNQALRAMRPGGRLIMGDPDGAADEAHVRRLEAAGFTRILVEALDELPGVLMRGEKPHTTADTLERVNLVAALDSAQKAARDAAQPEAATHQGLAGFRGRYVHLLVKQTPNKPVWALTPDDVVAWDAVAVEVDGEARALAFSSLPNAVAFMQAAVLAGTIRDVNRVAKFSRETAAGWVFPVLVNPSPDVLTGYSLTGIAIDPATAEAGGE